MNNSTMCVNPNPTSTIEMQEIIQKLRNNGYGKYVDCLLENDNECYTKKDRLNKSSTCRKLNCKNKQLEDALAGMRELLKDDFDFDDTEES